MTASQPAELLRQDPIFALYRGTRDAYLAGTHASDASLRELSLALCRLARNRGLRAEQLLIAIRGGRIDHTIEGDAQLAQRIQERSRRLIHATDLLLACYFSLMT